MKKEEPIKPEPVPHNPMTDLEEIFYMANKPSTFKDFKLWYENRVKPDQFPLVEKMASLEEAARDHADLCSNNDDQWEWNLAYHGFIAGVKHSSKPNLGMAKTSELIYELSARCDTGNIDKGGDYRTCDNF